jgi:hypothetical protein
MCGGAIFGGGAICGGGGGAIFGGAIGGGGGICGGAIFGGDICGGAIFGSIHDGRMCSEVRHDTCVYDGERVRGATDALSHSRRLYKLYEGCGGACCEVRNAKPAAGVRMVPGFQLRDPSAPSGQVSRRGPTVRGAHFAPGLCVGIVNGGALTARWHARYCEVCWRGVRATDGRRLARELWLAGCAMASWLCAGLGAQVTTDGERRKVSGLDLPGPISAVLMMR